MKNNIIATAATFAAIALISASAALAGGQPWFVQDHRIDMQHTQHSAVQTTETAETK